MKSEEAVENREQGNAKAGLVSAASVIIFLLVELLADVGGIPP
jgi:hypothetical protein